MSKGGRKPTPQHLKLVKGTGRKGREPKPDRHQLRVGAEPPEWLSEKALELWHEWAPGLEESGHLTERDWPQLALLCDAVVQIGELTRILTPEYLEKHADGKTYPQALAMRKHYEKVLQDASARLGFSPLDRQKLPPVEREPKKDPAEEFFTKGGS